MTDKRFPFFYSVLFGFCTSIMMILMILLFVEYRFFCRQVNELSLLKQQYSYYIDVLDKKINGNAEVDEIEEGTEELSEEMLEESSLIMDELMLAESSDAPDDDDEYADDFVVINRHPDYLKQSTLDYIESQELNALMTAIDIDRWSDYTPISANVLRSSFAKASAGRQGADMALATSDQDERVVVNKSHNKQKNAPNNKSSVASVPAGTQQQKKNSAIRRPAKECGFIWPIDVDKFWLSSLFGPRKRIDGSWGFHHGIDMAAIKGTAVKAARAGTVVEAAFQAGYGNTVLIKHSENLKTRYAHLHSIRVHVGQKIKQAAIVGTVGETGFVRKKGKDGSHLHFEVYEYGKRINPLQCLSRMT